MILQNIPHLILLTIFSLGYLVIIFEHVAKVNKAAVALLLAVLCWLVFFMGEGQSIEKSSTFLSIRLSDVSQILFFLLGAMTLVELIDSHKGFNTVIEKLHTNSKRNLLVLISIISFLLSAILDNLTTTILMVTLLRKLIPKRKDRFIFCCMVVIASNAGGAWTPIGDVTTTMLWINGQISTLVVMKEIFLPSVICMIVPLIWFSIELRGQYFETESRFRAGALEPNAHLIFTLGILSFIFVPIFKALTGMPPYMGMLISVAFLWLVTDILHHRFEHRSHLRIPHILTKIDVSSILFFLGILLSIEAIEATGMLTSLAQFVDSKIHSHAVIATLLGILSAIIDNVPLVAASMGMYDLSSYPMDSSLWLMIAYAAGTGGSILIIGSSAGVALMGMEKVDFIAYMKKASIPAFLGFLLGMLAYVYVF